MLHLHFVLLMLFTSVIGQEPEVTQHYRKGLVCEDISTKIENRDNACAIERGLRAEGFDSPGIFDRKLRLGAVMEEKVL